MGPEGLIGHHLTWPTILFVVVRAIVAGVAEVLREAFDVLGQLDVGTQVLGAE